MVLLFKIIYLSSSLFFYFMRYCYYNFLYFFECVKSLPLCSTFCNPVDCSLPCSSVHGFSRQEYWIAMPSSRGSSWPREWTCIYFFKHCLCFSSLKSSLLLWNLCQLSLNTVLSQVLMPAFFSYVWIIFSLLSGNLVNFGSKLIILDPLF